MSKMPAQEAPTISESEQAEFLNDQTREEFKHTLDIVKGEVSAQNARVLIREVLATDFSELRPDQTEYPDTRIGYIRSKVIKERDFYSQVYNAQGSSAAVEVFNRMSRLARTTSLLVAGSRLNEYARSVGLPKQCDLESLLNLSGAKIPDEINRLYKQQQTLRRAYGTGEVKGPRAKLLGLEPKSEDLARVGQMPPLPPHQVQSPGPPRVEGAPVRKLAPVQPIRVLDEEGAARQRPQVRTLPAQRRASAQPSEARRIVENIRGALDNLLGGRQEEVSQSQQTQPPSQAPQPKPRLEIKETIGMSKVLGHPGQIQGERYRNRGEDEQVSGYSSDRSAYHASIDGMGGGGYGDEVAKYLHTQLGRRLYYLGEGQRFSSFEEARNFIVPKMLDLFENTKKDLEIQFGNRPEMRKSGATAAVAKEFYIGGKKFVVIASVDDAGAVVLDRNSLNVKGYVSSTFPVASLAAEEGRYKDWASTRRYVSNPLSVREKFDSRNIKLQIHELNPGDIVMTFTDGVGDTLTVPDRNPNAELLPLIKVLQTIPPEQRTPQRIINEVHRNVRRLQGTVPGRLIDRAPNYKKPVWFEDPKRGASWSDVGTQRGIVVVPGKADDVAITVSIA